MFVSIKVAQWRKKPKCLIKVPRAETSEPANFQFRPLLTPVGVKMIQSCCSLRLFKSDRIDEVMMIKGVVLQRL